VIQRKILAVQVPRIFCISDVNSFFRPLALQNRCIFIRIVMLAGMTQKKDLKRAWMYIRFLFFFIASYKSDEKDQIEISHFLKTFDVQPKTRPAIFVL